MKIISAIFIAEGILPPKMNIITLDEDCIKRYVGIQVSRAEIEDLSNDSSKVNNYLISKISNVEGEEITIEQCLELMPSLENELRHLIRDKKIDTLI